MTTYVSETFWSNGHEKQPYARLMADTVEESNQAHHRLHLKWTVHNVLGLPSFVSAGHAFKITAEQRQVALDAGAVEKSFKDMVAQAQREWDAV